MAILKVADAVLHVRELVDSLAHREFILNAIDWSPTVVFYLCPPIRFRSWTSTMRSDVDCLVVTHVSSNFRCPSMPACTARVRSRGGASKPAISLQLQIQRALNCSYADRERQTRYVPGIHFDPKFHRLARLVHSAAHLTR